MTVFIDPEIKRRILLHARGDYPNECCGVLLSTTREEVTTIDDMIPALNTVTSDPCTRYQIDDHSMLSALQLAQRRTAELVGFYHSHPDQEPTPSLEDEQSAWPGCVYVIVGLVQEPASQNWGAWFRNNDHCSTAWQELGLVENENSNTQSDTTWHPNTESTSCTLAVR